MPFGDDDKSLVLEIQSNAQQAINDLRQLTENLAKLGGAGEQAKKGAESASGGFTALQAKIVAAHSAIGLLQQGWHAATATLRGLSEQTLGQVRAFAEYNQQLKNVSTQLGITAGFYQVLQARLERLGLGAESARQSLFVFNRSIEAARQGVGEAAKVIQELNVNADRSRSIEEIYLDVAKAISGLQSSTERARDAQVLFGRTGSQQVVVFKELGEGAQEFSDRLKRLGVNMDTGMVQSATRADAALAGMNEAMHGLSVQWQHAVTEVFTPSLEKATKALEAFAERVATSHDDLTTLIEVIGTITIMIVGPAGLIAAIAGIVKAAEALQLAFINLNLAAGPLGWAALLVGALGSAVIAWDLFGRKVDEVGGKLDKVAGKLKPPTYNQFWLTGEEPNWPTPDDIRDVIVQGGGETPPVPKGGAASTAGRPTDQQIQRAREAQQQLEQALASAAAADAERSRGVLARIDVELKAKRALIEQERDWAIKDAKLKADDAGRAQEISSIKAAADTKLLAADKDAATQRLQVQTDLGTQLSALSADQAKALGEQTIALQRVQADSQLALYQITYQEFYTLQREFEERQHQLDLDANTAAQAAARAGTEDLKKALDDRLVIEADYKVKKAKIDAEEKEAARQQNATATSLKDAVENVQLQAFGTPAQQRIAQLMQAQAALIKQLGEQPGGMVAEIAKVREAYQRLIEEATPGFINLGNVISQSLADGISGVIGGTESAESALKGLQKSISGSFQKAFADSLAEKLHFDEAFNVNFLQDLPAIAKKGATAIGNTFSNLFSYLSGGSGVGARVNVGEGSATSSASSGSGGGGIGGLISSFGGGSSAPAATPGSYAGDYGVGGFTAGDVGGQSTIIGSSAFGGGGVEAGAGGGTGGEAAAGGGGASVPYALIAMGIINANLGYAAGVKSAKKKFGASDQDVRNAGIGGAVGGVFSTVGLGSIGDKIAGSNNTALLRTLDFIFLGGLGQLLGLSQHAPSRTQQVAKLSSDAVREFAPDFPLMRYEGSFSNSAFHLPVTEAEAATLEQFGYGRGKAGASSFEEAAGRPGSNQRFRDEYTDLASRDPAVSAMRTGPVLGLAQVIFGNEKGLNPIDIGRISNRLTDTLLATGMSLREAQLEVKAFAESAGVTLPQALLNLRNQAGEGLIPTMAQLTASVAGVAAVFEDIPDSINVAALSMQYISGKDGALVLNARELTEEVQRQMELYATRVSTMFTGFADGINAAIDSYLAAHRLVNAALKATPLQDALMGASGTNWVASIVRLVAGAEKTFTGPIMQSFGQAMRQDLISNVYHRITKVDANDTVDTPWEKLTSGTLSITDLPATLADLWKQTRQELQAIVVPLGELDAYFQSMADSTEQMGVDLGDLAEQLNTLTTSALRDAFQALLVTAEEAEAARRSTELQVMEREQRIQVLDISIRQAHLFGDEIQAAELEMERSTLQQLQLGQQVALSTSELFKQSIKTGLQQAVVDALIAAVVSSGGLQTILVPLMEARQHLADAVATGDATKIAAARADFDTALANVQGAIDSMGSDLESWVNILEGSTLFGGHADLAQSATRARQLGLPSSLPMSSSSDAMWTTLPPQGVDWGPVGTSISIPQSSHRGGGAVGPGSAPLDIDALNNSMLPVSSHGVGRSGYFGEGGAMGNSVVINVTGNNIGDQATADYLITQMENSLLSRLKINDVVGH